jgi:hypothetical protein
VKTLAILILLGVCAYQQWTIRDLIHGLQRDQEVLNDIVWDIPGTPNIPREQALYNLENPPLQ